MKRFCLTILAFVAAFASLGQTPPATAPALAPIKVALLVTGSTSDGGWNQLADSSLKAVKDAGITTLVKSQISKDAAADLIRQLDKAGYGLVIAHGYEYLDVVKDLTDPAKPNPVKIKIAVSGGDVDGGQFQSLFYDLGPASYELGVIAGKVSKTGKIAFIGGAPFPTVTAMKRGFEAGAKSVNANITVAEQYTGWDDPAKAKTQVEAFIQQGCDVIMQNVDSAGSGVFEAVKEYNSNPVGTKPGFTVYTFGANSDQNANPTAGNWILASAVIKMDKAFATTIKEAQTGTFKGGLVKEDVANGICVAVLNPKLTGTVITKETQDLLTQAAKDLASGKIKIPAE